MSNYEDLTQRITDLLDAAEPGPWSVSHDYGKNCIVTTYDGYQHLIGTGWGELAEADAALIAAAPALLADSLSRITELEAEVARLTELQQRLALVRDCIDQHGPVAMWPEDSDVEVGANHVASGLTGCIRNHLDGVRSGTEWGFPEPFSTGASS